MKLQLPKTLLLAVLVACGTATADTGYSSSEKTMYLGGDQADHLTMPGNGTITQETLDGGEVKTTIDVIDFSGSGSSYKLVADDKTGGNNLTNAEIGTLTVADTSTLEVGTNIWDANRYFDSLVIENLVVANEGSTTLNVSKAENKVVINSIEGNFASISNAGNLTIAESIFLSKVSSNTGTLTLRGTVSETDISVSQGTLVIASDTATVTGKLYSNGGNITMGDGVNGGIATVGRIELSDKNGGDSVLFNVESGYTLKVTGEANVIQNNTTQYKTNSFIVSEWNNSTTMNVKGTILAEKAAVLTGDREVTINIENGGTLAAKGLGRSNPGKTSVSSVNLKQGGKLILGDMGLDYDGYVSANISGGTIGIAADSVTISDALNITGDVTLDTTKYSHTGNTIEQGTAGGKLILNGNLTGGGSIAVAGSGTLQFGAIESAVSISTGAANVIYTGTLSMGADTTLTIGSGSFAIDSSNISSFTISGGGENIVDKDGSAATNGFALGARSLITGGIISGEFTVQYGGQNYTINDSNRTFGAADSIDTSKWYIKSGSSSASEIYNQSETAEINVGSGTTLNVDTTVNSNIELAGNATFNIGSEKSLSGNLVTANDYKINLEGSGTYTINAGNSTNVQVNDSWTGKVQLFGQSSGNVDLALLGRSGSTIEIKDYVGYFINSGSGTKNIDADIILNNTNLAPIELTNGYTGATYVFNGSMTGDGNFIVNKDLGENNMMGFTFAGDVSAWTGKMEIAAGDHKIKYTGDATTINNAEIIARSTSRSASVTFDHTKGVTVNSKLLDSGQKLDLAVKNTSSDGTTFANKVDVTSATIEANTTAKFTSSEIIVDDVLVKAAAQLSFSAVESLSVATLEVQSGATVTVGTLENEKTLTVTSHATFSGGQVNANLAFADGAEVTLNQALSMGSSLSLGSNLTLSGEQYEAITSMTSGSEPVKLFTGVDMLTLGGDSYTAGSSTLDSSSGKDLRDYFSNVDSGKYYLGYNAAGDVYAGLIVPEPTTATLSLLALAGLMARRRRAK